MDWQSVHVHETEEVSAISQGRFRTRTGAEVRRGGHQCRQLVCNMGFYILNLPGTKRVRLPTHRLISLPPSSAQLMSSSTAFSLLSSAVDDIVLSNESVGVDVHSWAVTEFDVAGDVLVEVGEEGLLATDVV